MNCLPGYDEWKTADQTNEAYELIVERVNDLRDVEVLEYAVLYKWWDKDDEDVNGNAVAPDLDGFRERLIEKWTWEEL